VSVRASLLGGFFRLDTLTPESIGDSLHVLTYHPQATRIKLEVCSTAGAQGAIEEAGHETVCNYIGLDVHKETIAVAVAEADGSEVRFFGEIVNTPEALRGERKLTLGPLCPGSQRLRRF
jgi:methylase of polypeptide subunit release factors